MSAAIIAAVVFTIALVVTAVSWFRRAETTSADLGTVSHQWIAEQRFGPGNDSRR
jgi:hypothetical protein